jgi:O-antigen/teichoic acid export membrane protein
VSERAETASAEARGAARRRDAALPGIHPVGIVGQLRPIAFFKAIQLAGMLAFTVLAPRAMGPELFGEFAVVLSVTTLWMTSSNLGARYVFGRYVPEYAARGSADGLRGVFMQMVELRLLTVLVAAPFLWAFYRRALPEATTATIAAATAAFAGMTIGAVFFSVFYGFNRLATSMGREAFARWALLALLLVAGGTASLERATLALLAVQVGSFAIGAWLCRDLFTLDRSAHDPRSILEHLRFGLVLFAANLLLRMPWRLGESALALGGVPAAEIGFFNIALSAPFAFTRILGETATLQIPSLSWKQAAGDGAGRDRSLGLALKYLTVAAALFVLVVFGVGPWVVPVFWGERFAGVVPLLLVSAPAALAVPTIRTALSAAVVDRRLARNLQLGGVAVAVYAPVALVALPRWGGRGAAAALVVAVGAAAALAILQMRGTGIPSAARLGPHGIALAAAAAALLIPGGTPLAAAGSALLYVGLLFALRVLEPGELGALLRRTATG